MKDKFTYHLIKWLIGKKSATSYAIKMQIQSTKSKDKTMWWYWHNKIMNEWENK